MRILMAVDGSKTGATALLTAARMLGPENRKLDLMAVIPASGRHAHDSAHDRMRRRLHRVLEHTQQALGEIGISAHTAVRTGSPARVLVGASFNYDLTVVAATSHRTSPEAGLGPVASRLAEHAKGSVLLARESTRESGLRVLAPVDGSEGAMRALHVLSQFADLNEAEITLLQVVETPWLHTGEDQEWLGIEEPAETKIDPQAQFQQTFTEEAEAVLMEAREALPAGPSVTTVVKEGLPADEILEELGQGDYDLVVLGASGALDLKHKILGSVSAKVAWDAACSVLLAGPASAAEE